MEERSELFIHLVMVLTNYDLASVAESAEVSYSTLWNWVYGPTVSPRINTMIKVGNAIGMTLEWKSCEIIPLAA